MEDKKSLIERQIEEIEEAINSSDFMHKNRILNEIINSLDGKLDGIQACSVHFYDQRSQNIDKINSQLRTLKNKLVILYDEIQNPIVLHDNQIINNVNVQQSVNQNIHNAIQELDEGGLDNKSKTELENLIKQFVEEKSEETRKTKFVDVIKFLANKGYEALVAILPSLISQIH